MVVGIYIRVSTDEQAQEGYSISAQRERLKAFCSAQNWTDYKFYIDEGISGRNTDREQFKKLMDDIKEGLIDVLLVYRLDRLTRSVRDLHEILDYLNKYNCVFRSATEIYDTSNAMGIMFITIIAAIAQWESANLGERVKMGQIEKARQGERASQAPYGWYKDEHDKLHINHEEIEGVKLMVSKVKEGFSFRQLSKYMSSTPYKPKRGYKWHMRTIIELLHNPVLYGAMYWAGEIYENTHDGIMTKEEFDELQRIITSRQNFKKREVKSKFIYQSKIVCPDCGNRCACERRIWNNKNGEQRISLSYRCQACALNEVEYTPFYISEKEVTEMLIDYMKDFVVLPENPEIAKPENNNNQQKLLQELNQIKNKRQKYQRAWSDDLITDDEFKNLMSESRIRLEELEKELANLDHVVYDENHILKNIEYVKLFNDNFIMLTQEEKQSFIQMFVESIHFKIIKRSSSKGKRDRIIKMVKVLFY